MLFSLRRGGDHWRVHACVEARSCRIHYRCWRHRLFIKGGARGRLKKTYMLTSLVCFHPPTQVIPLFQEKRLCAHPFLEIYRDGQIHFMAPLARQGDFYVPEVRRVERRPPVKDGLQSDSEVSGNTFMLLSTIKSILLTRSTSENYQWNFLRMVQIPRINTVLIIMIDYRIIELQKHVHIQSICSTTPEPSLTVIPIVFYWCWQNGPDIS